MAFNLGPFTKIFGIQGNSISGNQTHSSDTHSRGNTLGLMPETGTQVAEHYQDYLGEFENYHSDGVTPPDNLDPDLVAEMEYKAAEAQRLGELKADYRAAMKTLLAEATKEYKAKVTHQTLAETTADGIQQTNVTYVDGNVQRTFGQVKREASFTGGLAAMRSSINSSQEYVTFE